VGGGLAVGDDKRVSTVCWSEAICGKVVRGGKSENKSTCSLRLRRRELEGGSTTVAGVRSED
jgi:hypothetical protein